MPDLTATGRPRVECDADGLAQNFANLTALCGRHGIAIAGVTKATGGNPEIARLMLDNGMPMLGDARLGNIQKLRTAGITAPIMLLRPPCAAEVEDAARLADIFLLSEITSIRALGNACAALGRKAQIILMVDLGDLREGVPPATLPDLTRATLATPNAEIVGIGTNLSCNLGVLPDRQNMAELVVLAKTVEALIGHPLRYISAGNSSALALMQEGGLPKEINHLRLGESLLLGRETAYGACIPSLRNNNFTLVAQIIEQKMKQPLVGAVRGKNALGMYVELTHSGLRRLAILNLGAVDTEISGLDLLEQGVRVVGHSSDHLIVDTTDACHLTLGDEIRLRPNYHALVTAMTSPYLAQHMCKSGQT